MRPNSELCLTQNKENCETCEFNMDYHYVFVQYYDIVGDGKIPKDGVDCNLNVYA